ncbi:MAG: hypothetical protein LBE18_07060, partial [Planctomycetaceae bacterium]|nr:hypothetical protein [Planctomycetaceae bacterium]
MKNFRTLKLSNKYSDNDITIGLQILNTAGIKTTLKNDLIVLNFDVVDMKYIENQQNKTKELLTNVLEELF